MTFYKEGRAPTDPMFMAKDRVRPYTYACASADTKMLIGKVQEDTDYGVHGFRVGGYNASMRGNGEELTVAHGLWRSKAHSRYARWLDTIVAGIPAAMVGEESPYPETSEEERPMAPPRSAQRRQTGRAGSSSAAAGVATASGAASESSDEVVEEAVPEGWAKDADGRYVPPAHLANAGLSPQSSLEKVRSVLRQLGQLSEARLDAEGMTSSRTRQGA
jgi:hypothetical protein